MRNWLLGLHQLRLGVSQVSLSSQPVIPRGYTSGLPCSGSLFYALSPHPQLVSKESSHTVTVLPSILLGILIAPWIKKFRFLQPIPTWLESCPPLSSSSVSLHPG